MFIPYVKSIVLYVVISLLSFTFLLTETDARHNHLSSTSHYSPLGFNDIFALKHDNVFAVAGDGLIIHFNGHHWTKMRSQTKTNLRAIWGRSAQEIYAVGDNGTILVYNGDNWQKMDCPTNSNLYSIWGFSKPGKQVYAGGRNGEILMYYDKVWRQMQTPEHENQWKSSVIYDIWGTSPDNLFAVGWGTSSQGVFDIFLHNKGGKIWRKKTAFPGRNKLLPESITGFAAGDIYIGSSKGVYRLQHGTQESLKQIVHILASPEGRPWSRQIWGSSNANIWFVGGDNKLYRYNADTDSLVIVNSSPLFLRSTGISGTAGKALYISGADQIIITCALASCKVQETKALVVNPNI